MNASLVEKDNFLKEIELMKRVSYGRCQYIVNTIGCCSLQEPLALVLEYMAYGDLLSYLRTSRRVVRVGGMAVGVYVVRYLGWVGWWLGDVVLYLRYVGRWLGDVVWYLGLVGWWLGDVVWYLGLVGWWLGDVVWYLDGLIVVRVWG